MAAHTRCITCGFDRAQPSQSRAVVCSATCAREAEAEARLLDGRLHQLARLTEWRAAARPWQVVLHPSQRREAETADVQIAELTNRQTLLTRAAQAWHTAAAAAPPSRSLAPRDVVLDDEIILADELIVLDETRDNRGRR